MLRLIALLVLALLAPATMAQTQPAAAGGPVEFRLDATQQAYLDQVLDAWEQQSGQIKTFSCDFTRLVYDPVFGPGKDLHRNEEQGVLSYQNPDKGSFQIKEVRVWDAKLQQHVTDGNTVGEHWVCDGKSVFEYKHTQKQLVERPIPPEMQGKSIVDGPLPFLFGAEAEKLKRRYWMRVDPRAQQGTIWLVAQPKRQEDAANYRRVELMLDAQRMLPSAMRVTMPDQSWTVYTFKLADAQINSRMTQLWNQLFQSPRTPLGWKRIVEQPSMAQAPAAPAR